MDVTHISEQHPVPRLRIFHQLHAAARPAQIAARETAQILDGLGKPAFANGPGKLMKLRKFPERLPILCFRHKGNLAFHHPLEGLSNRRTKLLTVLGTFLHHVFRNVDGRRQEHVVFQRLAVHHLFQITHLTPNLLRHVHTCEHGAERLAVAVGDSRRN